MERFDPPRRRMAIAIALLAGFVDAAGFLQVDGYYVSFMTGNTTLLAIDMVSGARRVLVPALLIAGFVLGVALGTWLGDLRNTGRKRRVLPAVIALLAGAATSRLLEWQAPSLACLVLAMGALNTTLSGNRQNPVGLTYMTGALVRVGQAIGDRIAGKGAGNWLPLFLLWAALLTGACLGATAATLAPITALWFAVAYAAVLLLLSKKATSPAAS